MTIQTRLLCVIAVSGFAAFAASAPAQALTAQECSAKYQAAKSAGTLNGQKWNDFRKAQCAADATPAAAPAAAPPPAAAAPAPAAPKEAKREAAPAAAPAARQARVCLPRKRERQGNSRRISAHVICDCPALQGRGQR